MNPRLSEFVRVYDDVLPRPLCERITRLFDHSSAHRSQVQGLKSFDELAIDRAPEWAEYHGLLERLKDRCLKRYQHDCPGIFPERYEFEAFRIKRYDPARSDEFREHVDAYNLVSAQRFLVCFWYLNDVEEGGETVFPHLGIKVRARAGRLVMFPPYWMFEHAGLPPGSGPKYIISTYFLFAE